MDFLIIILIVAAVLLVISMIFMTVYVIKSSKKTDEPKTTSAPASAPVFSQKSNADEHIRDFYDINAEKENKVLTFEEIEGEESTFGADLSGYKPSIEKKEKFGENKPEKAADYGSEESFSLNNTYDKFENDFKTESIDKDNSRIVPDDFDETEDFDKTENLEDSKPHLSVVLKYKDGDSEKLMKIINPRVTVGRSIGNDLLLSHNSFTGRNHAVFTIKDNKLYLTDLNSKNGTYINRTLRVKGEILIDKSCIVTFGDAEVQVLIDKEEG